MPNGGIYTTGAVDRLQNTVSKTPTFC